MVMSLEGDLLTARLLLLLRAGPAKGFVPLIPMEGRVMSEGGLEGAPREQVVFDPQSAEAKRFVDQHSSPPRPSFPGLQGPDEPVALPRAGGRAKPDD